MAKAHDYRTGYECDRCDSDMPTEATTLVSVYRARLCMRCTNEWDAFIRAHPLWRARSDNESRQVMLIALSQSDGHDRTVELQEVVAEGTSISTKLFAAAAQWIREA
jgi:hypothetical protein